MSSKLDLAFEAKFDDIAKLLKTDEDRAEWRRVKAMPPEIQGDDQLYVEMEALAAAAQPPPWDGGRGKPP